MYNYQSLRKSISNNDNELIIYGADNFSQFSRRDASVNSKCDRALPVARGDELVVLREKLDQAYHKWLRSHGLGSDYVVEYDAQSRDMTLSELIINNPEPVKNIIRQIGKKPVYVPWFSGRMETEAAKALGADLFGATETATLKYNSLSAGQMSIRIIFPDSVFKNLIIFIFYKYVLFMDKIAVFLTLELSELIFHANCWKSPHLETFKLRK